jgi:hypothetical protein
MTAGRGTPMEYLLQVIHERIGPISARGLKNEQAAGKGASKKALERWENEGGAAAPKKRGGKR